MSGAMHGGEGEPVKSAIPIADLTAVEAALAAGGEALKAALKTVRPADVGRDLSRRSPGDVRRLVEASDDRRAAAMLRAAHPSVAARALAGCDVGHAAKILSFLPTEPQVAMMATLGAADRARLEQALDPHEKQELERALGYPEAAVGRLMTPHTWTAQRGQTAGDAMATLRTAKDEIEVAQNLYVLDGKRLVGVTPLREVSIAAPDTALEKLMTPDPIAVGEDTERSDAAEIIRTHNFLSLPVIDKAGELVGAVRVDDLLDAALSKIGAELLNQGAVSGAKAAALPYFQTPITKVVSSRIVWLILLFVAETLTGTVLRHFEDELSKVVALSFFIPLLIGTGGNAGSQTVSTVIRALALGEVRTRDAWRVAAKEISAGLLLGLLLGSIAFGRALLWGVSSELAMCVGTTVFVVCTWANAVGALVPLAAERAGIDPTVISAPLITTLVDASGLFIYFSVAHLMITALH